MADVSMNVKILQVTKTTAQWASVTDVISKGLLCVELDTNEKSWVKIGDGVHTYAQLPYITDAAIASLGDFLRVKGVVATTSLLPTTGNKVGDVYFVGDATTAGSDKFEEYVWTTGSAWEFIGKISDPPTYYGGTGITIDSSNSINLSQATDSSLGGVKVGTNLSIDSSTGVLSATNTTYGIAGAYGTGNDTWVTTLTPSSGSATTSTVPKATTSVYGITTLTDSTSSTSTTTAATPNAVKSAYDLANGKSTVSQFSDLSANGLTIGSVTIDGTANTLKVPTGTTSSTVALGNHTHTTTIAAGTSGDTNQLTMAANTKYKMTTGGTNFVFTTPPGTTVSVSNTVSTGTKIATITVDGTANDINVKTTAIATSSASTGVTDLSANTKYELTAGNNSIVFKTPSDTTYEFADSYNASTNKGATVATVTNAINGIDFPVDDVKIGTASIVSSGIATIAVEGTYNSSSNKIATQTTVSNAIALLDGSITGTGGTTKTITSLSQTDGVVSATFESIDFPVTDVTVNGTSALSSGVAALGAAAGKDVTDNSTATAVTSTDTNLITGRTLYNAGYIKDVSINGTSGTTFTGIAKSATINGGATISADSSTGNIALTGLVTGLSYTNSSGTTSTLSPTNGNLDVTSLILNCSL